MYHYFWNIELSATAWQWITSLQVLTNMVGRNNSFVLLSCVSFLILQFLCLSLCFGTQLNIFPHLLGADCWGLCVSLLLNCVKYLHKPPCWWLRRSPPPWSRPSRWEHRACTPCFYFYHFVVLLVVIVIILIIVILVAHLVLHAGSFVVSVSWVAGSWKMNKFGKIST